MGRKRYTAEQIICMSLEVEVHLNKAQPLAGFAEDILEQILVSTLSEQYVIEKGLVDSITEK